MNHYYYYQGGYQAITVDVRPSTSLLDPDLIITQASGARTCVNIIFITVEVITAEVTPFVSQFDTDIVMTWTRGARTCGIIIIIREVMRSSQVRSHPRLSSIQILFTPGHGAHAPVELLSLSGRS